MCSSCVEAVFDFIFDKRFADEVEVAKDIFFDGGQLPYDSGDEVRLECDGPLVAGDAEGEEILEFESGEEIDEDTMEMSPNEKPIEWDEENFYDDDDFFDEDFDDEDETLFNIWYFHDYASDRYGSDMLVFFEKEKGDRLDEVDKEILASWKNTIFPYRICRYGDIGKIICCHHSEGQTIRYQSWIGLVKQV